MTQAASQIADSSMQEPTYTARQRGLHAAVVPRLCRMPDPAMPSSAHSVCVPLLLAGCLHAGLCLLESTMPHHTCIPSASLLSCAQGSNMASLALQGAICCVLRMRPHTTTCQSIALHCINDATAPVLAPRRGHAISCAFAYVILRMQNPPFSCT